MTTNDQYIIGVDLGGTNIATGVVNLRGAIIARDKRPTMGNLGVQGVIQRIASSIEASLQQADLAMTDPIGIGIGSPGPLSTRDGVVVETHNLGWKNVPIVDMIQEKTGLPVCLENDANAAAYAESWIGAGRGKNTMIMFTLGTGIGGGIVINGEVLHGKRDYAAELGHICIDYQGRTCKCGCTGCVEAYASATATVLRFQEAARAGAFTRVPAGTIRDITAETIFQWATRGDPLSKRILKESGYYLGVAIVTTIHTFNPDVVLVAGGMMAAGEFLMDIVRKTVTENAQPSFRDTPILCAELGDDAGLIGAAGCALNVFGTSAS